MGWGRLVRLTWAAGLIVSAGCSSHPARSGSDAGSTTTPCSDNAECSPTDFCAGSSCGGAGTCEPRPGECPVTGTAVCGCDGQTYANSCEPALVGVRVFAEGDCADAGPDAGLDAGEDAGMDAGQDGGEDAGCSGGSIDVSIDDGGIMTFPSICNGSWGSLSTSSAVAYEVAGGTVFNGLAIDGCATGLPSSQGLVLDINGAQGTGTYTAGSTTYTDSSGNTWGSPEDPFSVMISQFNPPGGVIEGQFTVFAGNAADAGYSLSGTFHVCRVQDENTAGP